MFLEALPSARVYSFDLADNPWSTRNAEHLRSLYGERFTFIPGDSATTLPLFKKSNPAVTCDVLLIDGSKEGDHRLNDIRMFKKLSYAGATIFLDEVNNFACVSGSVSKNDAACKRGPYSSCSKAYNLLSMKGEMKVDRCVDTPTLDDGFCVAHYL